MLRTKDLEYELPESLIATSAAEPRDSARLMVLKRSDPTFLEHRVVRDLPRYLRAGDLMVFNTTRVIPARLAGVREGTGGKVSGLYLGPGSAADRWVVMLRAGHLRAGARVMLTDDLGRAHGVVLELIEKVEREPGAWEVRVGGEGAGGGAGAAVLRRVGLTPLPPYILHARRTRGEGGDDAADRARYQTVYAEGEGRGAGGASGSVAAPTAGLHFTPGLLAELAAAGVGRADVTLDVGTGTFRPVEVEVVEDHPMHAELCSMSPAAVASARAHAGRLIAVGTTSARTLEAYAGVVGGGAAAPEAMETRLLITPGYRWRWVGGMVTNFHLPRSTLLAMIAALLEPDPARPGAGLARLMEVYRVAVAERYRFYSFGDAMLILP